MDESKYSEIFKSQEVKEIIDELDGSIKNRILWKIFNWLYRRGGFVKTVCRLFYYGGLYDAYYTLTNDSD